MRKLSVQKSVGLWLVLVVFLGLVWTGSVVAKEGKQKVRLVYGGGGPGSTIYLLAGYFAEYVRKQVPNVSLTAQTTQGFLANLRLLEKGEIDLGMTGAADLYQCLRRLGKFKSEKPYSNVRVFFPVWQSQTHWVTYRKNLRTLADLKGLRVNIGGPGSGTYTKAEITLQAAGLWDKVKKETQGWAEGARLLQDGLIDAMSVTGPPPFPAAVKAAAVPGKRLRFVKLGEDVLENIFKAHPELQRTVIPAGVYGKGIPKEDYKTCGYYSYNIAHKNVPEWAVYEIMKALLSKEGKKFVVEKVKTVNYDLLPGIETIEEIGMKLHPGAVRYWKEQGIKVPSAVIP